MRRSVRTLLPAVPALAAALFAMTGSPKKAVADPVQDAKERAERCATRLFTVMVGEGATVEALASATPQTYFDTLVKDPRFVDRFARFTNAEMNSEPGMNAAEDASFYMARYVLQNDKPWTDMFIGQYNVVANGNNDATVQADPNGLGYFRSRAWMVRYAGNESAGVRIVTAYRMMQNTIGLKLAATTNLPDGADVSAEGRKAAQCAGCHYNPWFALDKVAVVLGTRTGTGAQTQFQPSSAGPQSILGGVTISDDKELVTALVTNEAFDVQACRLAYRYLYGRIEYSCEAPVFDACVAAFKKDKKITTALATVAKDPTFCEQ